MKQFKTIIAAAFALSVSFGANAQDINAAIELFNSGSTAYKENNFEKAVADMEKAYTMAESLGADAGEEGATIKNNCKNLIPASYLSLGDTLMKQKKYEESLDYINKAKAAAEKYGSDASLTESAGKYVKNINTMKSLDLVASGDYDKAIESATATGDEDIVSNIKKRVANEYMKDASTAQKTKDWPSVISNAQKSLEYNPDNGSAYMLMGLANVQTKNFAGATGNLEKAVDSDMSESQKQTAYYLLGISYQSSGNNAKACQNYKKVTSGSNAAKVKAIVAQLCK